MLLTCVAAGAFSLASAAAKADVVVYNGGAPNLASAFVADSDASIAVYISFVLPAGVSSITDAEWWGGCYPATTCGAINPAFTTSVLSNTSSGPGAVIATHDVGGADQTATGRSISGLFAEYVYNASFPAISLTPETTYWFEITGTTGFPLFSVETTSDAPAGAQAYQSVRGGVPSLLNGKLALQLTDPVPEPATWAMLLVGFAALGYFACRRRHGRPKKAAALDLTQLGITFGLGIEKHARSMRSTPMLTTSYKQTAP